MIVALLIQLFIASIHTFISKLPTFNPDLTIVKGVLRMFWSFDQILPLHDCAIPLLVLWLAVTGFSTLWRFLLIVINLVRGSGIA